VFKKVSISKSGFKKAKLATLLHKNAHEVRKKTFNILLCIELNPENLVFLFPC